MPARIPIRGADLPFLTPARHPMRYSLFEIKPYNRRKSVAKRSPIGIAGRCEPACETRLYPASIFRLSAPVNIPPNIQVTPASAIDRSPFSLSIARYFQAPLCARAFGHILQVFSVHSTRLFGGKAPPSVFRRSSPPPPVSVLYDTPGFRS